MRRNVLSRTRKIALSRTKMSYLGHQKMEAKKCCQKSFVKKILHRHQNGAETVRNALHLLHSSNRQSAPLSGRNSRPNSLLLRFWCQVFNVRDRTFRGFFNKKADICASVCYRARTFVTFFCNELGRKIQI